MTARLPWLRESGRLTQSFAILAILLIALPATAEDQELKAAFIYRLATMTTWPPADVEDSTTPVCFAIVDNDPLVSSLNEILEDRMLHGRHARAHAASDLSDLAGCPVVFFGPTARASGLQAQTRATHLVALTLGDADDLAENGGMIQFVREGNRLRFIVNLKSIEETGLKLSSNVLRLARKVLQ